jgi:hypothetical protein
MRINMNQTAHARSATTMIAWLFSLLLLPGTGCSGETVRGSGVVKSESREVKDFTQIESAGSGEVRVQRGEKDSLLVEAEDNILPLIETTVKDGTLRLRTKDNVNIRTTKPIIFRITARELTGVAIAGSGKVEAANVDAKSFSISISGSGEIKASGKADAVNISISGSGSVDTLGMPAKTVKAEVTGAGEIAAHASEQLTANIVGSGEIEYTGNPQVTKRIVGSGHVSAKPTE